MTSFAYYRKFKNGRAFGSWIIARCSYCGTNLLRDPQCSGDFYPINGATILMSYCPECGLMRPILNGVNGFSKNKKRKMATKVAVKFDLGFSETKEIANSSKAICELDFFKELSDNTDIKLLKIRTLLE